MITEKFKRKKGLACPGLRGESPLQTPLHARVQTWESMRFLHRYLHNQTIWLSTEVCICGVCQFWSPIFPRSQIPFLCRWWWAEVEFQFDSGTHWGQRALTWRCGRWGGCCVWSRGGRGWRKQNQPELGSQKDLEISQRASLLVEWYRYCLIWWGLCHQS